MPLLAMEARILLRIQQKTRFSDCQETKEACMKKYFSVFLVVILLFLQINVTVPVQAELVSANAEIRVGLTSMYSAREEIKLYNSKLGYGYCIGNIYLQEVVLESATGFTFTPENGYFVSEKTAYASYQAAKKAADAYNSMGIEAYPGSTYQCSWRVYFGNRSKYAEAEQLLENISLITEKANFEVLHGNNYRVRLEGSFGSLLIDVDERYAYPQFRPLTANENGVYCVSMGSRDYRGRMEIGRYGKGTLTAVNVVPLEEYLYGVVPAEMPSTWHEEALKAQAVCSRSYALVKAGYGGSSNAKKGYKIVDTVSSQVYKGCLYESQKVNRAVDATKGEMVCYNNKVVAAYFFSTSGGHTENSMDVWAVDLPYLQGVPDPYESNASREVWETVVRKQELTALLAKQEMDIGAVSELVPTSYSKYGRIRALRVFGAERSVTLQGTTIRTLLNLNSTKFKIVEKGDVPDKVTVLSAEGTSERRISDMYIASADDVAKASAELSQYIVQGAEDLWNYPASAPDGAEELLLAGMGFGHGVGMSQYGAKGMAEAGYSYKEIIEYYYTGAYVR